jgi:hypothetical protein
METMILAALAALSLGVGSAHAAGGPPDSQPTVYGSQAFTDHSTDVAVHFLSSDTGLGRPDPHAAQA